MRFWLEVSSEYQWQKKIIGDLGLNAPNSTRYNNLLNKIIPQDIILHYITSGGDSRLKHHQSAIVGISKVKTIMYISRKKIFIDLEAQKELPFPIKKKDFGCIKTPSSKLKFLLRINFQMYLFELEKKDVEQIVNLNGDNQKFIEQSAEYGFLLIH